MRPTKEQLQSSFEYIEHCAKVLGPPYSVTLRTANAELKSEIDALTAELEQAQDALDESIEREKLRDRQVDITTDEWRKEQTLRELLDKELAAAKQEIERLKEKNNGR